MLEEKIKSIVRDVPDFPKEGIIFKDITPLFSNPLLCSDIVDYYCEKFISLDLDAIACVEARGFFFGPQIAMKLGIPFIPIRKAGKLPYKTISLTYDLEYGSATIEMHEDAVTKGQRIMIHDDLLATGGTAAAAANLLKQKGAEICGFSFLIDLAFLNGKQLLTPHSKTIYSLVSY